MEIIHNEAHKTGYTFVAAVFQLIFNISAPQIFVAKMDDIHLPYNNIKGDIFNMQLL